MAVEMAAGKLRNLMTLADENGRFKMMAIDQRGSLQSALAKVLSRDPGTITYDDMARCKRVITASLAPYATAVLTDPIAVTLRAVLRNPPQRGDTCLVIGCGILGLGGILCLRALHPDARVVAVAKHPFQQEAARRCGAHEVVSPGPEKDLFERVAALTGGRLYRGYFGRPILMGGVARVYDCVGSATTIETGLRLAEGGGRVVNPEYTYFLNGNAFGIDRGTTKAFYMNFQLTRASDSEIVFSKRYEQTYRQ